MRVEVIPQVQLGNVSRLRVGDFLNKALAEETSRQFRFAVAYMRLSGLDRLSASIEGLINRGGIVSGAIGIDDSITSIEALDALNEVSSNSTIFYTISGFIYHPKLYLISGERQAVAVVGSANLTADGLFRNVEIATSVFLDFEIATDFEVYKQYDALISELLDTSHPNVQPINRDTLNILFQEKLIKSEALTQEPGSPLRSRRVAKSGASVDIETLFPLMRVPVAPPRSKLVTAKPVSPHPLLVPPSTVGATRTFIMKLSSFDSSHRIGRPGTPEVLIPQDAIRFFPPMSSSERKHPDVLFDVILNTDTGRERHGYRFWYYNDRAEYRLRMNHTTIDLSNPGGGDLLVINRLSVPIDENLFYEVTILPQTDPTFPAFFSLCKFDSNGKKWGIASM